MAYSFLFSPACLAAQGPWRKVISRLAGDRHKPPFAWVLVLTVAAPGSRQNSAVVLKHCKYIFDFHTPPMRRKLAFPVLGLTPKLSRAASAASAEAPS